MNTKITSTFGLDVHSSVNKIILSKATHDIAEAAKANLKILENPEGPDKFILSAESSVDESFGGLIRKTLFIAPITNPQKTVPMLSGLCDAAFSKNVSILVNNLATFIKDLTPANIKAYIISPKK